MKKSSIMLSLFVSLFIAIAVFADDAAWQSGLAALKNSDLNQALSSFQQAAAKNPKNKEYAQEYLILRQVVTMQSQLDREANATRWYATAQRLRTYYEQKGVNALLLDIDRKIFAKFPTANNAALLGESLIANDKADEAVDLLVEQPEKTPLVNAVLGLAYLETDDPNSAQKIADSFASSTMTNPVRLRLARLEAGLGQQDKAVATLKTLFAQIPPGQQATVRELCKNATEFATFQNDSAFLAALQTQSKVTESACSGGSSCATCPMRSQCAGAK